MPMRRRGDGGDGGTASSKTGPAARCRFRPGEHAIAILDPARMTSVVYTRGTVALFAAGARAFRVWPRGCTTTVLRRRGKPRWKIG